MATVTDVNAQSSFTSVKNEFTNEGVPALDDLRDAATAAIAVINSFTFLTDANFLTEFTAAEAAILSPLIGDSGTNALHDRVRTEIQTGEFGIDSAQEDGVFDRMREREARVMASAVDSANRLFSSGGFTQPTGAGAAAIAMIESESRDKIITAGREQAIKHADLYLLGKKEAYAAGAEIDKTYVASYAAAVDKFFKTVTLKIDQLKEQLQAQATLANAAMAGMNVNLGLSVSGSASVGGSETVSEQEDKSANVTRKSQSETWDRTKSDTTNSNDYVDYHYTNET